MDYGVHHSLVQTVWSILLEGIEVWYLTLQFRERVDHGERILGERWTLLSSFALRLLSLKEERPHSVHLCQLESILLVEFLDPVRRIL